MVTTNLKPLPGECEAWLLADSDLVAEEMRFGLGLSSTTATPLSIPKAKILLLCFIISSFYNCKGKVVYKNKNSQSIKFDSFIYQ